MWEGETLSRMCAHYHMINIKQTLGSSVLLPKEESQLLES